MSAASIYAQKPWLGFYGPDVPEHVIYENICLPDVLDRTVKAYPQQTAMICEGYGITYRQMKDMVDRFATFLGSIGIKKGDAVAILLPNIIPTVIAYYAALRIGAIAVMNNPLYTDSELKFHFINSGAKLVVTLDLLANRMISLRSETAIQHVVYTSLGDYLPFPKNCLFPLVAKKKRLAASVKPGKNIYKWKECLARSQSRPPATEICFDDVAMYQYTGGTTGVAKAVMLTHANLSRQIQQIMAWIPVFEKGKEVMLGALPFFHVFGLSASLNLPVYMGWTNILVPKPQAKQLMEAITRYKPTFAPLVPTMYVGMLNHPDITKTDIKSIKVCVSGSAPMAKETIRDFEAVTGSVIIEGYGLTEASPVTHVNPLAGGERKVGSIGLPLPDTDSRIVDLETGTEDIPAGEPGEMIVRGPQVMKGYLNRPEETEIALRNGWLYTGDIATMDADGYFYIVDRKKDLIISSGYYIYPREVDEVFYENAKVKEACAVGIPDPKRGENIKVFVVLKEGATATVDEFIKFCAARLAKYKLPTEIEFRDDLPKSPVGKILRKQLREEERIKRGI